MRRLIADRRDGIAHSRQDFVDLARVAAAGSVPDYQLAAWLMAAYLRPLDADQTAWLTEAMAASGSRVDLAGLPKPWVDKHSTGGVGDKTTLVLLPLLAACGLTVVKMSGRGLGITGGTVDKLESIPGFRTDLDIAELKSQAARIGLALTGQTPDLAPADKALYALRDATATVASVPLIVSSILSKKIAGGAETIVLDVKCGSGAFMADLEAARNLKAWLADVGARCGVAVRAVITDMDQPLGRTAGNALEVAEAFETLRGGRGRLRDLCLGLAEVTLTTTGVGQARQAVECALDDGTALAKARTWMEAQGGDPATVEGAHLPSAPVRADVPSPAEGWVAKVDARTVGETVVQLGGGRTRKEDAIDPSVGVETLAHVGGRIAHGQPIFRVHAASDREASLAAERLLSGVEVSNRAVAERPLFLDL